jgi:hypothetical protein
VESNVGRSLCRWTYGVESNVGGLMVLGGNLGF